MTTKVRTRIAPSPTGPCHLGTARTALFNYLFARHCGGTFIFRLEDTDRDRSTKEFEQELYDSLHWLGLHWDEGPDVGLRRAQSSRGDYGPYRQSERAERHRAAIARLVESSHAYRCFCTAEALEAERQRQLKNKELVHYGGTCRDLPPSEIEANLAASKPFTIRFRMPDETFTFTDLIRGEVTVEGAEIGDFVIAKQDGSPIFHLSNVVDDAEMGITHVIRGEDHLPNVPKHVALFRALASSASLGHEPPVYAHLPLILNPDGSKMSKRKDIGGLEPYVRVFRERGYLPEAMVSYLALLGWSPGAEEAILTLDELVERFSLEAVSKSGARFDLKKLDSINGRYLRALPNERIAHDVVAPHFPGEPLEVLLEIVEAIKERVRMPSDGEEYYRLFRGAMLEISEFLYSGKENIKEFDQEKYRHLSSDYDAADLVLRRRHTARGSATMITEVLDWLEKLPDKEFTTHGLEKGIKAIAERPPFNWKARHLFMVIRAAVTGQTVSPPLFLTMKIIGKERCIERLRFALRKLDTDLNARPWPKDQM